MVFKALILSNTATMKIAEKDALITPPIDLPCEGYKASITRVEPKERAQRSKSLLPTKKKVVSSMRLLSVHGSLHWLISAVGRKSTNAKDNYHAAAGKNAPLS